MKQFQNPRVHVYQSYHKESAYAVNKEKDVQKLTSKPSHDEKETEEQVETGRVHHSLRDRRGIEKPEAVTRQSEITAENSTNVYFTDTVPYFPGIVDGTSFPWWMTTPFEIDAQMDKRPETYLYLIKLFLFLLPRK